MTTEARYLSYFSSALSQQNSSGDIEKFAQNLLQRIEAKLRADGFAADVISNEMGLARIAAAKAVAGSASPPAAREVSPHNDDAASVPARRGGPLRFLRSIRPLHVLFAILGVIVYALPLLLFVREGRDNTFHADPGDKAVTLGLQIGVADFGKESVTFHILPAAGRVLDQNGRLAKDLTLEVDPGTGPVSHTFKANAQLTPWTVKATVDAGDIMDYPFDKYQVELAIDAKSEGQTLKVFATLDHVPHGLTATAVEHHEENGDDTITVSIRRAGTIIFVAFLSTLSLMLVSIAACSVAWQVAYRGRKIEFSMMVWVAALLFVIPTVRGALPGGVPAGALIDFLIFFWLQIAAVVAMTSLVITWIRRTGT